MTETKGTVREAPTGGDVKTSEVFRRAKDYLMRSGADEGVRHICVAIYDATGPIEAADRAADVIRERLGGRTSVEFWLRAEGVNPKEMTSDNVQAWRHAWLDQLIAEFEAKGD